MRWKRQRQRRGSGLRDAGALAQPAGGRAAFEWAHRV